MARVCVDKYPAGYSYNRHDGFYMDDTFKKQLDFLIQNITDDWDFTIIISGGGEVRVGKSMIAQQIGAYWTHQIEKIYGIKNKFTIKNVVFDSKKLIEVGHKLGQEKKHDAIIHDEAGADVASKKVMTARTKAVMDYFRECGQYNFLNILVLPDFFDLPKSIALTRSIFLLDVYYKIKGEKFQRGYFKFYSRPAKKELYMRGRKAWDYKAAGCDFPARFYKFFPLDEQEYRNKKNRAFKSRDDTLTKRQKIQVAQRDASWWLLKNKFNATEIQIAKYMKQITGVRIDNSTISTAIKDMPSSLKGFER